MSDFVLIISIVYLPCVFARWLPENICELTVVEHDIRDIRIVLEDGLGFLKRASALAMERSSTGMLSPDNLAVCVILSVRRPASLS